MASKSNIHIPEGVDSIPALELHKIIAQSLSDGNPAKRAKLLMEWEKQVLKDIESGSLIARNSKTFVPITFITSLLDASVVSLHDAKIYLSKLDIGISYLGHRNTKSIKLNRKGKIDSSERGRELANKRHGKQREKRNDVKELAASYILRGSLNHSEICKELKSEYPELTENQVLIAIKEKCLEMGRSDLVLGHKDYRKP